MSQYANLIFTYNETLTGQNLSRVPAFFHLPNQPDNRPRNEILLFRLLLGTLDISHNYDISVKIKQRANFSVLGSPPRARVTHNSILGFFEEENDYEKIKRYFAMNSIKNNNLFGELLSEFSNYFYQRKKKSPISAFLHLYRCMEHLSFTFPLMYAAKSRDYKGTFDSFKSFLEGNDKGEIGFYKKFQEALFRNDLTVLGANVHLDLSNYDISFVNNIKNIYAKQCHGFGGVDDNGTVFTFHYRDMFQFALRLRNRYFHHLKGTWQENISSTQIWTEALFEPVNENLANWIAFVYFEICKSGISSM